MGYRYEYEEVDGGLLFHLFESVVSNAITGEDPESGWRCTIYDEDTDEELASGLGMTQDDAKGEAEGNL